MMIEEIKIKGKAMLRTTMDDGFMVAGKFIPIPAGYIWDGSSIPSIAQPIVGGRLDERFQIPSRNHDFCFLTHCCSFREANRLFYDDLRRSDVNLAITGLKSVAVSTFGYWFWIRRDAKNLRMLENILHPRPDCGYFEMHIKRKGYRFKS